VLERPDEALPELAPPAPELEDIEAPPATKLEDSETDPDASVRAILVGVVCTTVTFPDGRLTV